MVRCPFPRTHAEQHKMADENRMARVHKVREHVPRHTGGTGRHIIQETNCVVHPYNTYVKFNICQLGAFSGIETSSHYFLCVISPCRSAQSARSWQHVPRHTGGTGRHIIQETNCGASLKYTL